ncbi:tetratricopeptide repeat protein [Paraglaciecola sp.]|uniref:tetratricopeptide repeat protein n=1 Tax=Paraglaciecola sp. TaxID=1920173 RepID=UPI003EF9DF3B
MANFCQNWAIIIRMFWDLNAHILIRTIFLISMLVAPVSLASEDESSQSNNVDHKTDQKNTLVDQMWGEVLYEFYQGHSRQGLVQLAKNSDLGQHGQQALVAKGGMSLVHGLVTQAEEIFVALADAQEPEIQAQAWFWLTKSYFDSGQWQKAQDASLKTAGFTEFYKQQESELLSYMQAQMLVALSNPAVEETFDNSAFQDIFERLPVNSVYRPYLLYNRGLIQLEQGELFDAIDTFKLAQKIVAQSDKVNWRDSWWGAWTQKFWADSQDSLSDPERDGLNDRLNLAMGYANLTEGRTAEAMNYFANIRQHQQDSANALLGYAQALAHEKKVPLALSIWQKISVDFPGSISALQSLLAMAWQLEIAGDEQQAWDKLQVAESQLSLAKQDVSVTFERLEQVDFLDSMLSKSEELSGRDQEQGDLVQSTIQVQTWPKSQVDILQTLLAGQPKQQLESWLELSEEQTLLAVKQTDLVGFKRLLDERKQTAIFRGEQVAKANVAEQVELLRSRVDKLEKTLQLVEQNQDASLLANDTQIEQLNRLKRAKDRLLSIKQVRDLSPKYAQRLARVEGLLTWHFADNFEPLLWQHKQTIEQAKVLLAQSEQRKTSLLNRLASPPSYQVEYQQISLMHERIQGLQQRLKELKLALVENVTSEARQALYKRTAQLKQVELNIQLAKLRLQDKNRSQLSEANHGL